MASGTVLDKSKYYKTRSGEYLGKFRLVTRYEDEQQGMGVFRGYMFVFDGKDGGGYGVTVRDNELTGTFNVNKPTLPNNVIETTKQGGKRKSRKSKKNKRNTRRNN